MERDMDPAACLLGAARRDIDDPLVGEPVAGLGERLLVEQDETSGRLGGGLGQRTVDPGKDGLGLVVVAVAYVRGG